MIDIHCHILPDIDDGPGSWDESLDMARIALNEGINKIIATPHYIKGTKWETDSEEIKAKVEELNIKLNKQKIEIKVYPGMEVAITENIPELIEKGDILKIADTDFLLLEVPFNSLPFGFSHIVKELIDNNIIPILAHPERCFDFQKNPESIKKLVDIGALVQVTSLCFRGDYGKESKKCSIKFSKMNIIDFIATDAHSTERRPPLIKEALKDWQKYSKGGIEKFVNSQASKLKI